MERICFDDYFMTMALWVSCRSSDYTTRHGTIIVDQKNRVLGVGYNGSPRSCPENLIPQTRPEKYFFYVHSETNCLLNSNNDLQDAKAYVTGHPCLNCLGLLIQKGIKEVIYGPIKSTNKESPNTLENINKMKEILLTGQSIILREWKPTNMNLIKQELNNILETLINDFT